MTGGLSPRHHLDVGNLGLDQTERGSFMDTQFDDVGTVSLD